MTFLCTPDATQPRFAGLQDVLKTSSSCLQCYNFSSSKMSSRRLTNMSWRPLEDMSQDILKTSSKTKNFYADNVLKKSWRHVFKSSWRRLGDKKKKSLLEISVSNHGLLTYLENYVTNLYLANLYLTNLRWIRNALIRIQ